MELVLSFMLRLFLQDLNIFFSFGLFTDALPSAEVYSFK